MRTEIFAIFDTKAQTFTIPFFQHNAPIAIRAFSNMINGDHQFAQNPHDYSLHCLGEYDDITGEIIPKAQLITEGRNCINIPEE